MKKNILVLDDDPSDQESIAKALENEGHATVSSFNFEDALEKARQILPDLFLVDVVMPDITGFEACRKIKEMFQPHPPPVIVMTGNFEGIDPLLARKKRADDFVVKTSDMAVLTHAVRRIFSRESLP